MCCYHGAHVNEEQAQVLQRLAQEEGAYFASIGVVLPETVIVEGHWRGQPSGGKTALKPWGFRALVEGFPAHWEETACVFLTPEGYCGLQALAASKGLHPWYFKPFTCWLHPIVIPEDCGIMIYEESNDPTIYPDYPGFNTVTPCGALAPEGLPAHEVLAPEIAFLGAMLGRDLLGEIREALNGC